MFVAGVAPWCVARAKGRAVSLRIADDGIVLGRRRLRRADVSSFSVASGARGKSVALTVGRRTYFIEIERDEDASRIRAALAGDRRVPFGALPRMDRRRALLPFAVQALVSFGTVVSAAFYALTTMGGVHVVDKAQVGIPAVVLAQIGFVLFAVRALSRRRSLGWHAEGAFEQHLALHLEPVKARSGPADDRRNDAEIGDTADGVGAARRPRVRVGVLARGSEPVGAWLARLDGIPTTDGAYRGDAMKRDVLWEALADAEAPIEVRMAAARLLRRRYGEDAGTLVRIVDDADERIRVEAAMDEAAEAEARLEALGPLFRAR
jgi:hypothetical protein